MPEVCRKDPRQDRGRLRMPAAAGAPILDGWWIFASYAGTVASSGSSRAVLRRRTMSRHVQHAAASCARSWISSRSARNAAGERTPTRSRRVRGESRGSARMPPRRRSCGGSARGARGRGTAAQSRRSGDRCCEATGIGPGLWAASWLLVVVQADPPPALPRAHPWRLRTCRSRDPWPPPMHWGAAGGRMDRAGGPESNWWRAVPSLQVLPASRRTDARRPTARVHRHLRGTSTDAGLGASPDVAVPVPA